MNMIMIMIVIIVVIIISSSSSSRSSSSCCCCCSSSSSRQPECGSAVLTSVLSFAAACAGAQGFRLFRVLGFRALVLHGLTKWYRILALHAKHVDYNKDELPNGKASTSW